MDGTSMLIGEDVELVAHRSPGWHTERTVAVLLHGIGMTHLTFERMQPLLAARMPVVSFDLPGFGPTSKPSRPFAVEDHAAAVDSALRRLGVDRFVAVGHSMGVQFAVELARLRPDAAAGIVLIGPVVDPGRRTLATQAGDLALDMLREPPRANARVLVDYFRGGIGWYLANLKAMFDYPTEEKIREVECRTVVVRGERDPVARDPWCRQLVAAAGGPSQLVTVPGRAHVVPLTAADAAAEVVAGLAAG